MINPLLQNKLNNNSNFNNGITQLETFIKNNVNPQDFINSYLKSNPGMAGKIQELMNCGRNPKDYVMNYLYQQGVDFNQVIQMLSSLGIKL